MADWAAFATAFMKDTAGYINERKDKAEDYEEKQRELAEKNTLVMQKRKQISTAVGGIAKRLIDQGVPEEVVRTAAASGPTGLTDLDKKWSTAINDYGADFASANPELVSTMVSTNLSAEQLGMGKGEGAMSLEDFLNSQYGLSKTTAGDYKAEETGVFRRMMGYGATDRARQRLDEEMAGMGMSVYDINQAAKMSDFESAVPGASVTYGKMPSVFGVKSQGPELRMIDDILSNIDPTNKNTLEELQEKQLEDKQYLSTSEPDTEGTLNAEKSIAERQIRIDKLKQKVAEEKVTAISGYVLSQNGLYFGDSYLKTMSNLIDQRVGLDGYTASLMKAAPVNEETDATRSVAAGGSTDADVIVDMRVLGGTPFRVEVDNQGQQSIVVTEDVVDIDGETVLLRAGGEITGPTVAQLLQNATTETQQLLGSGKTEGEEEVVVDPPKEVAPVLSDLKALATEANYDKDGDLKGYAELYSKIMSLPEDQRSTFVATVAELEQSKNLFDLFKDHAPNFANKVGGAVVGVPIHIAAAVEEASANLSYAITGDAVTSAQRLMTADEKKEAAKELLADGIVQALQPIADNLQLQGAYQGAGAAALEAYDGEDYQPQMVATELNRPKVRNALYKEPAIERLKRELLDSKGLDKLTESILDQGYKPSTMMATELNRPKVRDALSDNKSDDAIVAESEASQGYQSPKMMATELNRPKVRNALSDNKSKATKRKKAIPADEDQANPLLTKRQERLLYKHGADMTRDLRAAGVKSTSSDEEINDAISKWASSNRVDIPPNTPENRRAIILYVKQLLKVLGEKG